MESRDHGGDKIRRRGGRKVEFDDDEYSDEKDVGMDENHHINLTISQIESFSCDEVCHLIIHTILNINQRRRNNYHHQISRRNRSNYYSDSEEDDEELVNEISSQLKYHSINGSILLQMGRSDFCDLVPSLSSYQMRRIQVFIDTIKRKEDQRTRGGFDETNVLDQVSLNQIQVISKLKCLFDEVIKYQQQKQQQEEELVTREDHHHNHPRKKHQNEEGFLNEFGLTLLIHKLHPELLLKEDEEDEYQDDDQIENNRSPQNRLLYSSVKEIGKEVREYSTLCISPNYSSHSSLQSFLSFKNTFNRLKKKKENTRKHEHHLSDEEEEDEDQRNRSSSESTCDISFSMIKGYWMRELKMNNENDHNCEIEFSEVVSLYTKIIQSTSSSTIKNSLLLNQQEEQDNEKKKGVNELEESWFDNENGDKKSNLTNNNHQSSSSRIPSSPLNLPSNHIQDQIQELMSVKQVIIVVR